VRQAGSAAVHQSGDGSHELVGLVGLLIAFALIPQWRTWWSSSPSAKLSGAVGSR
jgi:hypothetical protein